MPALVKTSVGSLCGTSEELRTTRWPRSSKNLRNVLRNSLPVQSVRVKDALSEKEPLSQTKSGAATRRGETRDACAIPVNCSGRRLVARLSRIHRRYKRKLDALRGERPDRQGVVRP